jgi:hypothetical protein
VHLLHVTLTLSTGRHPSRAIVQLCLLWLGSDFQAEEEPLKPTHIFKVLLVTGMSFFPSMNFLWL